MRPPPSSTLFPYTTLFRSDEARASVRDERERDARERGDPQHRGEVDRRLAADESRDPRRKQLAERVAATDRKSTRLNSSHRTISYAVFCLKKKNFQFCHAF